MCGELRVVSGQGDLRVSLSKSGQSAPRNKRKLCLFLQKEALFCRSLIYGARHHESRTWPHLHHSHNHINVPGGPVQTYKIVHRTCYAGPLRGPWRQLSSDEGMNCSVPTQSVRIPSARPLVDSSVRAIRDACARRWNWTVVISGLNRS